MDNYAQGRGSIPSTNTAGEFIELTGTPECFNWFTWKDCSEVHARFPSGRATGVPEVGVDFVY